MKIDKFNLDILKAIQNNQSLAQRELAEIVNLSPNACWHRVQSLKDQGVIIGQSVKLDRKKIGFGIGCLCYAENTPSFRGMVRFF